MEIEVFLECHSPQQGFFNKGGKLYGGHHHKKGHHGHFLKGARGKKGHKKGVRGHHHSGHKKKVSFDTNLE